MAHAALLSGIALANSGLGLAHGVAAGLGVIARVPHGLACAMMLPAAMEVNREVCQREFAELAHAVIDDPVSADDTAAADRLIARIRALAREVGVPERLGEVGLRREQLDALVPASRGNSMSGNPRQLDDAELRALLESML
jgi:alcohol dehydrogenase class IV